MAIVSLWSGLWKQLPWSEELITSVCERLHISSERSGCEPIMDGHTRQLTRSLGEWLDAFAYKWASKLHKHTHLLKHWVKDNQASRQHLFLSLYVFSLFRISVCLLSFYFLLTFTPLYFLLFSLSNVRVILCGAQSLWDVALIWLSACLFSLFISVCLSGGKGRRRILKKVVSETDTHTHI